MNISAYYKKLFRLPSVYIMVMVVALELLVMILLMKFMGLSSDTCAFMLLIPILSNIPLMILNKEYFTLSRTIFLSMVSVLILWITMLMRRKCDLITLAPETYFNSFIITFLRGVGIALLILVLHLALGSFILSFRGVFSLHNVMMFISLSMIPLLIMVSIIKKYVRDVCGLDFIELCSSFLRMWLAYKIEPYEEYLKKICEEKTSRCFYIAMLDRKRNIKGLILIPEIHPGPFRNLGSSDLPSRLMKDYSQREGFPILFLHGAVTHEEDVAVREDVDIFLDHALKEIKRIVRRQDPVTMVSKVMKVRGRKYEAYAMVMNDYVIVIVSTTEGGIEDLPLSLWRWADEEARRHGFKGLILIDAHNAIDERASITQEDLKDLEYVIKTCIDEASGLRGIRCRNLLGAMMVKEVSIGLEEGMGLGGIGGLYLKYDEDEVLLTVLDGNNMRREFKDMLERALHEAVRPKVVIVTTTDTHIVCGLELGGRGYRALGEHEKHKLLIGEAVELAKELKQAAKEVGFLCGCIDVGRVRVYGKRLHDMMKALDIGYRLVVKEVMPISTIAIMLICLIV
ncbi:MAG: hypothetical protein DRN15_04540 [Thermoprotei archaeon]|nr:MAG: hypothetical protein DRN15_04540 [Thermoprotei archaeon]